MKNYANEQKEVVKQELLKEDMMIIIYKKGKEIKSTPNSLHFQELKKEIESIVENAGIGYELIPDERTFNQIKKGGYAIELAYNLPYEIKIKKFTQPINMDKIFIPLSKSRFPSDVIFVFETQKDFPHCLTTDQQNKDRLLKLID